MLNDNFPQGVLPYNFVLLDTGLETPRVDGTFRAGQFVFYNEKYTHRDERQASASRGGQNVIEILELNFFHL